MGYDLSNRERGFRWNIWGWGSVINLGLAYGWQPKGTELDKDAYEHYEDYEEHSKYFEHSYFGNDGQLVLAEDAKAFSDALESALDDIPDEDLNNYPEGGVPVDKEFFEKRSKIWNQEKATLVTTFSGEKSKDYLRDFISFLREGTFAIY